MRNPELAAIEIAAGVVFGCVDPPSLPRTTSDPLEAIEAAVDDAVKSSPCLVSFSGGVDSSLVLAAATRAARRLGLPDPVPITWRFTDATRAEESDWQELVIRALGIAEWERVDAGDDLDWIGPVAQRVLTRHGLLYPANSFLVEPLAARAKGGSLLTGAGGDQILGTWHGRNVADLLAGRRRASWRDPWRLARAIAPLPFRAARERRRAPGWTWLCPAARADAVRRFSYDFGAEPLSWKGHLRWELSRRDRILGDQSLAAIASAAGAKIVNPLLDLGVVAALGQAGGRLGFGNRSQTISAVFPGLLPHALLGRRDKAIFNEVFWRQPTREFIATWNRGGVDPKLVDRDVLGAIWCSEHPDTLTSLLVQQTWLRAEAEKAF